MLYATFNNISVISWYRTGIRPNAKQRVVVRFMRYCHKILFSFSRNLTV